MAKKKIDPLNRKPYGAVSRRRRQAGLVLGNIQVRLIERQWLDQIGVALEDLMDILRRRAVTREIWRHEDSIRAQAERSVPPA